MCKHNHIYIYGLPYVDIWLHVLAHMPKVQLCRCTTYVFQSYIEHMVHVYDIHISIYVKNIHSSVLH